MRETTPLAKFTDIHELTMFPDYRVPQILVEYKVMVYSENLKNHILAKNIINSGSPEEVNIIILTFIY
jgi:hypothetical protein